MTEECDCGATVYPQDPYYSSPCGTMCSKCMAKHIKECEICRSEFREDFDDLNEEK